MTDPAAPDLAIVERMNDLADRCEAAKGPDRELDQDIIRAVDPHYNAEYTRSLDAAMTLVPEGALWGVEHKINVGTSERFKRPKGEPSTDFRADVGVGDVPVQWTHGRSLASSALALCAASLRAIAKVRGR